MHAAAIHDASYIIITLYTVTCNTVIISNVIIMVIL